MFLKLVHDKCSSNKSNPTRSAESIVTSAVLILQTYWWIIIALTVPRDPWILFQNLNKFGDGLVVLFVLFSFQKCFELFTSY